MYLVLVCIVLYNKKITIKRVLRCKNYDIEFCCLYVIIRNVINNNITGLTELYTASTQALLV